jgi:predicted GNAT family acetyltransferase
MELTIEHAAGSGRSVARTTDGRTAGHLSYRAARDSDSPIWTVYSTVVDPSFGGRGVGSALVADLMAEASDRAVVVVPTCWFVAGWLDRHPEYAHLRADDGH